MPKKFHKHLVREPVPSLLDRSGRHGDLAIVMVVAVVLALIVYVVLVNGNGRG